MGEFLSSRFVLAVPDLRASTSFYMEVLGFNRDFGDESDGWSFLSRENVRLMLGHCPDALPAKDLGDHSYVAHIILDGIEELYQTVQNHGVELVQPLEVKPWGLREFGIRTIDGHRIMFGEVIS